MRKAPLLFFIATIGVLGTAPACTATQGKVTSEVLTGLCEAGAIVLAAPGVEPICADISLVEQLIANWNKSAATGATVTRPISQTDLYMMAKASGQTKPARVK